ncbi:unnamed protein product [Adineta ricciae]|uniref:Uncharacterized protein n=1 Tax=Adineta ricciae TaxID=249248 RepID=A0A813YN53_ADIRI|nr:unnamed protein product [Adineta ricciae]CAF1313943.1 unnamed protein product [Adineta ricciae]
MTWNSACSIASDDESSRHSFLSDCDSEFDLRPPPRYPAEKRSYSTSNKQTINRIEPPLTRSRAKALEKSLTPVQLSSPPPSQKRQSTVRRSVDVFTGMASALTNNLNTTSILFPKQESTNERISTAPLDGVNILADRFESCSLDEGRLNKNCLWPSRETNSHYQRPIPSSFSANMFDTNAFSPLNHSPLFRQQQAQLWSRFRYAASTLRDNLWTEQTDSSCQQVPSNIFTSNHNYLFNVNHHPTMLIPPQTVPTRLLTFPNRVQPAEEPSSSLFRQRKITSTTEPIPSTHKTDDAPLRQTFSSKLFFTLTIFVIGLTLGYLLTNTLPPSLAWKLCVKYFQYLCLYVQATLNYLTTG